MFLRLDLTAWTAILALATVLLAAASVWLTVSGRRHDDRKRAEDRARDDRLRDEERARDDRLRSQALTDAKRQERLETIARENMEARQVLVKVEEKAVDDFTHLITVSAPHSFPIKQVEGRIVHNDSGNMGTTSFGQSGDAPTIDENRIYYTLWTSLKGRRVDPIIRFTDWHGNRFYQYLHFTERFGPDVDFLEAAVKIDKWVRTSPGPDSPEPGA